MLVGAGGGYPAPGASLGASKNNYKGGTFAPHMYPTTHVCFDDCRTKDEDQYDPRGEDHFWDVEPYSLLALTEANVTRQLAACGARHRSAFAFCCVQSCGETSSWEKMLPNS